MNDRRFSFTSLHLGETTDRSVELMGFRDTEPTDTNGSTIEWLLLPFWLTVYIESNDSGRNVRSILPQRMLSRVNPRRASHRYVCALGRRKVRGTSSCEMLIRLCQHDRFAQSWTACWTVYLFFANEREPIRQVFRPVYSKMFFDDKKERLRYTWRYIFLFRSYEIWDSFGLETAKRAV